MSRTTWNIDDQILREVKDAAEREGKSAGDKASELLAVALRQPLEERPFTWIRKPMGLKIDLEDKDQLYKILDER